jgi:hypothetical protein
MTHDDGSSVEDNSSLAIDASLWCSRRAVATIQPAMNEAHAEVSRPDAKY